MQHARDDEIGDETPAAAREPRRIRPRPCAANVRVRPIERRKPACPAHPRYFIRQVSSAIPLSGDFPPNRRLRQAENQRSMIDRRIRAACRSCALYGKEPPRSRQKAGLGG